MTAKKRKLHVEPRPDCSDLLVNVAFATSDRHKVDQHFGSAKGMLIFGIGKSEWHLLEAIEYPDVHSDTHQKLPHRIRDLKGCAAVYCVACGASAVRQLLGEDISPVKVDSGQDIHRLLSQLQAQLKARPSGWLFRSVTKHKQPKSNESAQNRLEDLMDEDW
ncbi:NifB/NifX family molybdenum-iron cluster-binding protein [Vibrio hangzhouensis]|uniref:Nitrogen fixation protein NifX n=1 Tax=Vibrio hangzhouensis TaxID=462991 RepID=A0A1H5TH29_9VIBR|nr:NifB/NifX family molybdenum-iron cluster-binding protein [Vibrio hangzhouensis]SEF62074.1 nitrogen fixation protein NifX [Vibrio hangzhouensis]